VKDSVQHQIDRVGEFVANAADANALPREAGQLLHMLILATGARSAVEVGTSYGYSGLWMAAALEGNGGKLITIDNDTRKLQAARRNFEEAGLSHVVQTQHGNAIERLGDQEGPIDFVLLDADKENCIRYVELLRDKLADRAVVVTDNTRTHSEQLAPFLDWIRGCTGFHSVEFSIGNGMELTVKCGGD